MEHPENTDKKGSALIITMILLIVIMGLAGSYLTLSISGARVTTMEMELTNASYLAETAISIAISQVNAGNSAVCSGYFPPGQTDGSYDAYELPCPAGSDYRKIIGTGTYTGPYGDATYSIEVYVKRVRLYPFTGAAFGNTSVSLAVFADSYNSSEGDGTYGGQATNSISLEDANESCTTCAGTGSETCATCSGSGDAACGACSGGSLPCVDCGGAGGSNCGTCGGSGFVGACTVCSGTGRTPVGCTFCGGDGLKDNGNPCVKCDVCANCSGSGGSGACGDCGGDGTIECATCSGSGTAGPCGTCGGDGLVTCGTCTGGGSVTCGTCTGTGIIPSDPVTYADVEGDVGANETVTIAGSGVIFGNATSGPNGTVTNGGYVYGDTFAEDTDRTFDIPAYNPSGTSLGDLSSSTTIAAGTYHYDSVNIAGSNVVTITGDVIMYVDGDFKTAGNGEFKLASGASLILYHDDGDFHIAGKGIVNEDNSPTKLVIISSAQSTPDPVNPGDTKNTFHFNGLADFAGAVYAPGADMKINGQTENYGSLVGRNITTSGSGKCFIHYDEALEGMDFNLWRKKFVLRSWRRVWP
jgi:type II secretory pathway pseudopilin PulG